MRNRHLPRICRHCQAPMASGDDACWRCGTKWATEVPPATTLQLVADPPPEHGDRHAPVQPAPAAVAAVSVRS
jgi:predicted amidophosphoribosyltransferase